MFPTQVNVVPALGVEGDFADANPRVSVVNQQGAFVAGPSGLNVGYFGWADASNRSVSNAGQGAPTGFVARMQQALITLFLGEATQNIPAGLPITLFSAGAFFVRNNGLTSTAIGQKAYADNVTGKVSFAATGTPTVGGTSTASTIAATTSTASSLAVNTVTGSISGTTLTVTAVAAGAIFVGQTLSGGSGANLVNPATTVVAQLTGTANGVGTYQVNVSQNFTSATITGSGSTLTVGGTVTGFYSPGEVISGASVLAGSTILAQLSGTAGLAGTYAVTGAQTLSSQAINATGGLLTIGGTVTGTYAVNDLIAVGASAGTFIKRVLTGAGQAGTYLVNTGQTVASTAINVNSNTETKFVALSIAAPGELVKMSSHVLG